MTTPKLTKLIATLTLAATAVAATAFVAGKALDTQANEAAVDSAILCVQEKVNRSRAAAVAGPVAYTTLDQVRNIGLAESRHTLSSLQEKLGSATYGRIIFVEIACHQ